MKMVKIQKGNKTVYKFVEDDWIPEEKDTFRGDLTTGGRKSIGYSDIPKADWDRIFGEKDEGNR